MPDVPFSPHPYQWRILESTSRFTLASSGIQAGKTTIGAVWMIQKIQKSKFTGTFLLAAPTYKILNQSTLPKFFEMCGGVSKIGKYKKSDQVIELHGGQGRIYIRSCEDPDYLEGMTITEAIWLDEAGQMSEKVFINIVGRGAIKQAPILLTTTPYKVNWVFREIIKRWQKGDKNYTVVMWKSIDNPVFPKDEWEQRKATMNEADFARRYGGEWRQLSGLVYQDYSYDKCVITQKQYDPDWEYFVGIDWGFTNPTAIVFVGVDPYEGTYYILDEFYQGGKTATEICDHLKDFVVRYPKPIRFYYCDPAGRDEIATFTLRGIRNIAGVKAGVMDGIRRVTELFRLNKVKIFANCVNLVEELEEYHLPQSTDSRDPSEDPVKRKDHLCDAFRYLVYNTIMQYGNGMVSKPSNEKDKETQAYDEQRKWFERLGTNGEKKMPPKISHL